MRLWSLDPSHLDGRGLVALWREGLLARAVLRGETVGYRHHPQLRRFLAHRDPVAVLDCYLSRVLDEARGRGYRFNASKINYQHCQHSPAEVSLGQLMHEWDRLLAKLAVRDPAWWHDQKGRRPQVHGCFRVVAGPIADWEKRQARSTNRDGRWPPHGGTGQLSPPQSGL